MQLEAFHSAVRYPPRETSKTSFRGKAQSWFILHNSTQQGTHSHRAEDGCPLRSPPALWHNDGHVRHHCTLITPLHYITLTSPLLSSSLLPTTATHKSTSLTHTPQTQGAGLSGVRYYSNNKKMPRRGLDAWDRQMMDRDLRLTGVFREQTDNVEAPLGYEVSSKWKTEKRIF